MASFAGIFLRSLQGQQSSLLAGLCVAGGAAGTTSHHRLTRTEEGSVSNADATKNAALLRRRMTAIGHFSVLSETEFNPSIVTFFLKLSGQPFTAKDFGRIWKERDMPGKHPRFHQTVSDTVPGHFEQPEILDLSMDDIVDAHVTETVSPVNRKDLIDRVATLQTDRWPLSDSLWHAYVASLPSGGMVLFRGHHALGDGASLGAALLDVSDEADSFRQQIADFLRNRRRPGKRSLWDRLQRLFGKCWWFVTGSCKALFHQATLYLYALVDSNPWAMLERQNADPTPGRSVSWTTAASVDQVKWVARTLAGPKATVNDVFVTCVSGALAKQMAWHRKKQEACQSVSSEKTEVLPVQKNQVVVVPVHLKGGVILPNESVSNQIGALCVRVPGEMGGRDGVDRLQAVHRELYSVKRTPAAFLSHWLARTLTRSSHILPARVTSWLFGKASANAVAVVTNTRGSPKPFHLAGRRVEEVHGFVPLPPGIPIGVVVNSYTGMMSLTLTAQPWAVSDADQFLVWVLEEYLDLVEQAKRKQKRLDA